MSRNQRYQFVGFLSAAKEDSPVALLKRARTNVGCINGFHFRSADPEASVKIPDTSPSKCGCRVSCTSRSTCPCIPGRVFSDLPAPHQVWVQSVPRREYG